MNIRISPGVTTSIIDLTAQLLEAKSLRQRKTPKTTSVPSGPIIEVAVDWNVTSVVSATHATNSWVYGDWFGTALAVDSTATSIVVGAHDDDDAGSQTGSIFVTDSSLSSFDSYNRSFSVSLGESVAMSSNGMYVAAGAPGSRSSNGSVVMYKRSGSSLSELQVIDNPNVSDQTKFGFNVALSHDGSTLVICTATISNGVVYVYLLDGDQYVLRDTIISAYTDRFYPCVDVSYDGNTIVVGNSDYSGAVSYSGAVYTYKSDGENPYVQAQIIYPPVEIANARYGHGVNLSANMKYLYVSESRSKGNLHVYLDNGTEWTFVETILPDDILTGHKFSCGDRIGQPTVSSSSTGRYLAVGTPTAYITNIGRAGKVHIFEMINGVYSLIDIITQDTATTDDRFGSCVAISEDGSTLVIAAEEQYSGAGGSVFVYNGDIV